MASDDSAGFHPPQSPLSLWLFVFGLISGIFLTPFVALWGMSQIVIKLLVSLVAFIQLFYKLNPKFFYFGIFKF